MKFVLELPGYWPNYDKPVDNMFPEMIESALMADKLGFDAFLIGEHHFMDYNSTPDPFAIAAYLAALTKNPRLIIAVLQLPLHDVERLAGNITQLDQLTQGRVDIGVGRGGSPYESTRFGLEKTDYDTARAIYEARWDALQRLLTETDVTINNDHVSVNNATIMPPLFQKPMPPVWMASMRPESAYYMGKMGVNMMTGQLRSTMDFVKEVVDAYRSGLKDGGLAPDARRLGILQWVYIAKDKADRDAKIDLAYQRQRQFMSLLHNTGPVDGGIVKGIDIDGTPEDYAPSLVIGEENYVKDRVAEFAELGFDDFITTIHVGPDREDLLTSLEKFGTNVMPMFHDKPAEVEPA